MTQQEARALVRKECRRRQRKGKRGPWGAENRAAIRAMRAEIADLKVVPFRWARAMTHLYWRKRRVGDGCYVTGHAGSFWDGAE